MGCRREERREREVGREGMGVEGMGVEKVGVEEVGWRFWLLKGNQEKLFPLNSKQEEKRHTQQHRALSLRRRVEPHYLHQPATPSFKTLNYPHGW